MSRIEEKIKNNKKHFNNSEPAEGHFDRFKDKLSQLHENKEENKFSINIVWKIAASAVILVAISLVFLINTQHSNSAFAVSAIDQSTKPEELKELDNYYSHQTDEKLCTINELCKTSCDDSSFKEIVKDQLAEYSDSLKELENDYSENNKDERTFSAIVNNYRLLIKALDTIIENFKNQQ